jgi:hypothetical protein
MKYLDRGAPIAELQRRLMCLGYELYGGADGALGPVTWHVLGEFANDHGIRWVDFPKEGDPIPHEVPHTLYAQENIGPAPFAKDYGVTTFDLRHEMSGRVPHSKIVRGRTALRTAESITGICVHQMGKSFEVTDHQIDAAGGSKRLAKARRFKIVPAHVCVSTDQFFSVHAELQHHLYHGHGFNPDTLAIEIEGAYGEYLTDKKGDPISEELITTAREAFTYLVRAGTELGMPLKYIYAHRQSHRLLVNDPGEAIWRNVALWASETFDLEIRPRHTRGDGLTLPSIWYSRATSS